MTKTKDERYTGKPLTDEWCQACDTEVVIPMDRASRCPSCGKRILPCSRCPELGFWRQGENKGYESCHGSTGKVLCPFKGKKIWEAWDEC